MPSSSMSILVVGPSTLDTDPMLAGLAARGWGSRSVLTLREAQELLQTFRFGIVLAAESLADGRGYDLVDTVARHSGTLLVGVALSESFLWLPVLHRGANVLGKRAVKADLIEYEVEMLLRAPNSENVREIAGNSSLGVTRPGLHHAWSPRRKISAAASGEIPTASSAKSAQDRQQTLARAEKEHNLETSGLPGAQPPAPEPLRTRTTQPAAGMRRPARPD